MIRLPVSEAYAFDYLSILRVKIMRGIKDSGYADSIKSDIEAAIGKPLFARVMRSQEMAELNDANLQVFDAIERAHRDEIRASAVQRYNRRRFDAKKALQERFWPSQNLYESKT